MSRHESGVPQLPEPKKPVGSDLARSPGVKRGLSIDQNPVNPSAKSAYFADIGRPPFLSAEKEASLAGFVQAGFAARTELSSLVLGTMDAHDRKRQLEKEIEEGNRARDRLIDSNLLLVANLASRFVGRGLDFEDLVQEGNIGLYRAAEKFDPTKARFSTYATLWIKQAIGRAIMFRGKSVRTPPDTYRAMPRIYAVGEQFESFEGRKMTVQELAKATGFSEEIVREAAEVSQPIMSLDMKLNDEGEMTYGDIVPDDHASVPRTTEKRLTTEGVREVLQRLPAKHRGVLEKRFGLGENGEAMSLAEIARELGVSRQRVSQIEIEAIKRLKSDKKARRVLEGINW